MYKGVKQVKKLSLVPNSADTPNSQQLVPDEL